MMKKLYRIISSKLTIFSVFLFIYLFGIISLIITKKTPGFDYIHYKQLLLTRSVSFLTCLTFAYLAYRGVRIITWIVAIFLLGFGCGTSMLGVFKIGWSQYILKFNFIIFGIYFIFGGIVLIREILTGKQT